MSSVETPEYCLHCLFKIYSINDSVEMRGNQFQPNISVKLNGNFQKNFSIGNFIILPVNLTEFFNS